MQQGKHKIKYAVVSFLLFFGFFLLHYSVNSDISVKTATPIILLPLLTAFSMFVSPGTAAATGLALGICMDGVASGALCFNAVVLMLSAAFISALSARLFNRNVRSAFLLTLIFGLAYFVLRWLVFYAFSVGARDNLYYLLHFAVPGVVYTVLFIFPFYFIFKRLAAHT